MEQYVIIFQFHPLIHSWRKKEMLVLTQLSSATVAIIAAHVMLYGLTLWWLLRTARRGLEWGRFMLGAYVVAGPILLLNSWVLESHSDGRWGYWLTHTPTTFVLVLLSGLFVWRSLEQRRHSL
jgi:CHASE2 domain-containing sensor protein